MAKETSRFAALRGLRDQTPPEPIEAPAKRLSAKTRAKLMTSPDAPGETPPPPQPPTEEPPRRGRGRPKGKRSNSDYEQSTIYLPSKLKKQIFRSLEDDHRDLSELVTQLLHKWHLERMIDEARAKRGLPAISDIQKPENPNI